MSTNRDPKDGRLEGQTRDRSQFEHPNGHWIKRDAQTGRIVGVKHDADPFKYVRREK